MAKKISEDEKKFGAMLRDKFSKTALTFIFGLPLTVAGFAVNDYINLKNKVEKNTIDRAVQRNINEATLETLKDIKQSIRIIREDGKKILRKLK